MARVTVEDCLEKVPNRFALTVLAFRRARELLESRGTPLVHCDNKAGVTALREVETGGVRFREDVVESVSQYAADQRSALERGVESSGALDLIPFAVGDGEDGDDFGIVEELKSDLTQVGTANAVSNTDDADRSPEGEGGQNNNVEANENDNEAEATSESTEVEGAGGEAGIEGEAVDEDAVGAFLDGEDDSEGDDESDGGDDGDDASEA